MYRVAFVIVLLIISIFAAWKAHNKVLKSQEKDFFLRGVLVVANFFKYILISALLLFVAVFALMIVPVSM